MYIAILVPLFALSIPIVWMVLDYKQKKLSRTGFSEEDSMQLDELMNAADSMAERIKTLESILDVETPEWREKHGEE